jgi:hypothetical protein
MIGKISLKEIKGKILYHNIYNKLTMLKTLKEGGGEHEDEAYNLLLKDLLIWSVCA